MSVARSETLGKGLLVKTAVMMLPAGRSEPDSYGCIKWQPAAFPEGETAASLETMSTSSDQQDF